MKKNKHKRLLRNFLINKEIQLKIVLINLLYILLIIIITLAVLLSPILYDMFISNNIDIQYKAAQNFLMLMKHLVPAVCVMFILTFIHQIIFSHRFLGPLINFGHTFNKISDGDFTRNILLRKGDFLQEESEKINEINDSLAKHIDDIKNGHEKLILAIEKAMSDIDDVGSKKEIIDALDIAKKEALIIKDNLSLFKITDKKEI